MSTIVEICLEGSILAETEESMHACVVSPTGSLKGYQVFLEMEE
jgi:hypothetical protein